MPIYLLMFVTNRCHAKCQHCFYWRELNKNVQEELSLSEYTQLAHSLGPLLQVTLTGGSPEIRTDLPEIAEIFSRLCRPSNLTICMLGYTTSQILKHAEKILALCPRQKVTFAISLDGLGEEHDRLRDLPNCFEHALTTLQALGELRKCYSNVRVGIGTTVHGLNYQTAEQTARWARESLPIDLLKPILIRGEPSNRETLNRRCLDTYLKVIDQDRAWLNGRLQGGLSLMDYVINSKEAVQREIISSINLTGRFPVKCAGGQETAVIYPTGNVAGCELRDDNLGNLRDSNFDFKDIWFGQHADRFRDEVGKVDSCRNCYHHCFISPAIFRTPKLWPRLVQAAWTIYRNPQPSVEPVNQPERLSPQSSFLNPFVPVCKTPDQADPNPPLSNNQSAPADRTDEIPAPRSSSPSLLIVIPVRRVTNTLPRCLAAVRDSFLDIPLDIVVVDDDDVDNRLEEQLARFNIRVLRSSRPGSAAAARNLGSSLLKEGILVFLDSDVILDRQAIRRLIEPIQSGRVEATVGNYSRQVQGMTFLQQYKQLYISTVYGRERKYLSKEFWTAIGAIRADVFHRLKGFDSNFKGAGGEDTDMGHRLTGAGYRIMSVLDATGIHLHHYTLSGLLRNDFRKGIQILLCSYRNQGGINDNRHSSPYDVLAVCCAYLLVGSLSALVLLPGLAWVRWLPIPILFAWALFRLDLFRTYLPLGGRFLSRAIPLAWSLDLVRGLCVIWVSGGILRQRAKTLLSGRIGTVKAR